MRLHLLEVQEGSLFTMQLACKLKNFNVHKKNVSLSNDVAISVVSTFEPNGLLEDPVVKQIADKNGKTPGQILLRFLTIEGITVIPKSSNPRRIRDNIDV